MRSATYACLAIGVVIGRFLEFWWVSLIIAVVMVGWHGYRYTAREADQP